MKLLKSFDEILQQLNKLLGDFFALETFYKFSFDVNGGDWLFHAAGQTDGDVGVLGFAGTVDHAAHDGDF